MESGFMKIIGLFEVLGGISLIINKYVPLSLTILAAIIFNAVIFHALYDISGIVNALITLIIIMVYAYIERERFKDLLRA